MVMVGETMQRWEGEAETSEVPSRDDDVFREEFKDRAAGLGWESDRGKPCWAARVCEAGAE